LGGADRIVVAHVPLSPRSQIAVGHGAFECDDVARRGVGGEKFTFDFGTSAPSGAAG
jgi:hypothetical protein